MKYRQAKKWAKRRRRETTLSGTKSGPGGEKRVDLSFNTKVVYPKGYPREAVPRALARKYRTNFPRIIRGILRDSGPHGVTQGCLKAVNKYFLLIEGGQS